jgi:translocation and assembly module TamB
VGVAVAALLVLLLAGLWVARVPLATRFVDRELARRSVPARYTVAGLGPRGQRLENVVLGNPARPDLVADWIETETGIGLSGPYLSGVRVGRVRIRARLVDGRVRFGSLDRLMPPPSGKPFALPALRVDGEDVRIRLETPAGPVGLRLAGEGRLNDGFRGTLAAVAPRLAMTGCEARQLRASVALRVRDAAPLLSGPVQVAALTCGASTAMALRADMDLALGAALDRWRGGARLASGRVALSGAALASAAGQVSFNGTAAATTGHAALTGGAFAAAGLAGRSWQAEGDWRLANGGASLSGGQFAAAGLRLPPGWVAPVTDAVRTAAGTPVAPLGDRLTRALTAAARSMDASATLEAAFAGGAGSVTVSRARLEAATGATAMLDGIVTHRWPDGGLHFDADLGLAGGGLPALDLDLIRTSADAPVQGLARLREPYAAGGAALALAPVRFRAGGGGATMITTTATVTGPLGDGRVERLVLPIDARWSGGALALNPSCTPVGAAQVAVAGLVLDRPRLSLCPTRGALVRVAGGRVSGGARIGAAQLAGRLGSSPLSLQTTGAELDLATRGFRIAGLQTRLGQPDRPTRLDFAALDGRITGGAVAGSFTGGSGQIGAVPLILGDAAGAWQLAGGRLSLDAALSVRDAADAPRFQPMQGEGVRLTLANGAIEASGRLIEPITRTPVANVTLRHQLSSGTGEAQLAVPNLTFREGFQPELLTRVTFGIIADVRGTLTGDGRIAWDPEGVTSTGSFGTQGTDLAAAFGPVQGIAGTIAFDDLLSLRSAPNQRVSVRSINPGIEVTDGIIRFRTLSSTQVQVDNGHWPFAGGTLTLQPTLLDFGQDQARRMTFAVTRASADKFLQQFAFDNLNATGTFDGELPMVFDQAGGRIEGGRLAVREGGGTIAYVGDLTEKELGFWGDFAFQALRSLRYRDLAIQMNGPLAGEMITDVRFAGVSQGEGAKSNFLIKRLQRLPLVFNIRIAAPFRGLIDSVQSFYDPSRLVGRNLPALLDAQTRAANKRVQPPASETVP